jgi:hypothetical protein
MIPAHARESLESRYTCACVTLRPGSLFSVFPVFLRCSRDQARRFGGRGSRCTTLVAVRVACCDVFRLLPRSVTQVARLEKILSAGVVQKCGPSSSGGYIVAPPLGGILWLLVWEM